MPPRVADGKLETPLGDAPIFPLLLVMIGGYCAWFGVHYWRDQNQKWPSDPLKSFLTGKGLPAPEPHSPYAEEIKQFGSELKNFSPPSGGGGGGGATGSAIADDALKYQGAGYNWGGPADKPGNWDCSSFVSYVLGHDLHMALPGGHWGDPGFPPNSHGPTTGEYLVFGSPIDRSQVQAGDLIVWPDHIAIATSNTQAISAHDHTLGTGVSNIDSENAYHGGLAHYRRVGH